MDVPKVSPLSAVGQLSEVLDSPEIAALVSELEATRWTGRPGYPIRSMVGMALAKSIYAVPTWTRTVALVREHAALRFAIAGDGDVPSVYAVYRFMAKLRVYSDMLAACIDRVTASLHGELPELGRNIAIDGSDMPAYANGQRFVSKGGRERSDDEFSDQDASWGHRSAVSTRKGGGFYGYKLGPSAPRPIFPSLGTCEPPATASPFTRWRCSTRHASAGSRSRRPRWTRAMTTARSMTAARNATAVRSSRSSRPPGVKRGDHKPPTCEHGDWTFAGSDSKRGASKWRCPTGECKPASVWIKASRLHPLIPRETPRFTALYRRRASVEREFGRLKHEWALAPLRVRGLDRVKLHADLTILAKISCALSRARAVPLAA